MKSGAVTEIRQKFRVQHGQTHDKIMCSNCIAVSQQTPPVYPKSSTTLASRIND